MHGMLDSVTSMLLRLTSEEQARFGIMTCSKRKLITPRIPARFATSRDVVVADLPEASTTAKQPSAHVTCC